MKNHKLLSTVLIILTLLLSSCKADTPAETLPPLGDATSALGESGTSEEVTTEAQTEPPLDVEALPESIYGGAWNTSHVQGIAVDLEKEYMYFSFTTVFVKTDLEGNIVGTVENLVGHLGDLDFNKDDGRVYGSFEFNKKNVFYIAVFDVDKIDKVGMDAESGVLAVIELPEVEQDFTVMSGGKRHRYGCSGIDGVAFGPSFGNKEGKYSLMVAYGIYGDISREDNDYQIILEYKQEELRAHEKPFSHDVVRGVGAESEERFFAYTGNTTYGIQNLEYDESTGYWFLAVYRGEKKNFPNYALFAVDGSIAPYEGEIIGQPNPEKGLLLTLADDGEKHAATGIRGWQFGYAETGIASLGDGYFYISHRGKTDGKQICNARLYRFAGGKAGFELVK